MSHSETSHKQGIRLNFVLEGDLADFLEEMKRKGRVNTYVDAVIRGLTLWQKEEVNLDMMKMRLENYRRGRYQ